MTRAEYNAAFHMETPPKPDLPMEAIDAWNWWNELNSRRPPGFDSIAPISYTELIHWIVLSGNHVSREEISWILDMDNAWIAAVSRERREQRERNEEERESEAQASKNRRFW